MPDAKIRAVVFGSRIRMMTTVNVDRGRFQIETAVRDESSSNSSEGKRCGRWNKLIVVMAVDGGQEKAEEVELT